MNGRKQILFGIVLICFIFGINYLIFDKKLKSLEEKNLKAINLIKDENMKAAKAYINKFKEEITATDVALPEQIQELFEAFERKDEKLDNKRIEKAIKGLSEKQLIEVFVGIKWESDSGQKLQKYLIDNKVFTKKDFEIFGKEIPDNIDIKKYPEMTGVYKCGGDSKFLKCMEPCITTLRCCFYRCCCWPVCGSCDGCLNCIDCKKHCCCFGCCGDCGDCGNCISPSSCCFPRCCLSRKIWVGPEQGTGEYVYTSKLYFDGNVEVIDEISSHSRVRVVINDSGNVATLDGDGKVPVAQLPDTVIGCIKYQGDWDAIANTPPIPGAAADNNGHYYTITTADADPANNTTINGINDWKVNDWIVSNGTVWKKLDNTDSVTSVEGQTGAVNLDKDDVGLGNVPNTDFTAAVQANTDHRGDTDNPHGVDNTDVGLGNVPNTDFTASVQANTDHRGDTDNPHGVDNTDVGLGNVPNTDFTASVQANTDHRGDTDNPHGVDNTDVGLGNVPNTDFTAAVQANTDHRGDTDNPHGVDNTDVGLGNVPNTDFTADVQANTTHRGDTNNPHGVDKTDVGLSNVPNTDFTTDVQANTTHRGDMDNPHGVDKTDVGLSNVTNEAQIPIAQKGAASGVATLDADQNVNTVNKVVFGAGNLKTRSGGLVFGTGTTTNCRTVQISGAGGNCD